MVSPRVGVTSCSSTDQPILLDLVVQKPKKKAAHSKSKPSGKKSLGDDSDFAASGSAGSASKQCLVQHTTSQLLGC